VSEQKYVLVLRCRDCGAELNRTHPLTKQETSHARVASGFAGRPCPNGCRSTFSDLNINTRIDEETVQEQP